MKHHEPNDEGQTSVFVVGITVVILLVSLTIGAIMSVTLQHRKLLSLADSAAQSAATAFTLADPEELSLAISQEAATTQVTEHLRNVDAEKRFSNLNIEMIEVIGDTTVSVQLSATAHPPIVNWVLPAGVEVFAQGTARTQLEQ